MSSMVKKAVAVFLAGAFILVGFVNMTAEAGTVRERPKRQLEPARVAAHLSEIYGVSQISLLKHHAGGLSFRELRRAAYFTAVSGKSLDEVIALKTEHKDWKSVSRTLAITKEQHKAQRQQLLAARLQLKDGTSKETSLALIQSGSKLRDVVIASAMAKESGKSINEVIAMKTEDVKWRKVGADLGLDKKQITKSVKKARIFMGGRHNQQKNCK